ncbi:unnamed protein product [Prunus armeniaca]|uniref:Uncharacterized protein n=1 Tax=Prunus armeniaca TaxID=36596 RepID=A0A6J5XGM8_PRUAR|nr:unnamed protein product [Prunus armeniaca]
MRSKSKGFKNGELATESWAMRRSLRRRHGGDEEESSHKLSCWDICLVGEYPVVEGVWEM